MKTNKLSLAGKVIVIFSCIMLIVMVLGKWLKLDEIPMIFGNSMPSEFSLFEISDYMDEFNEYLESKDMQVYSVVLSIGAFAVIALSVITIIAALINKSLLNVTASSLMSLSAILAAGFVISIIYINKEIEEASYGLIKDLFQWTAKPYLLAAFAILNIIGASLKCRVQPSTGAVITYNCTGCGAEVPVGVSFCTYCGKKKVDMYEARKGKFCIACGAEIDPNMTFCVSCGAKVDIN